MTPATELSDPPCPVPAAALAVPAGRPRLFARRTTFDRIPRQTWDALVDRTPSATPFSRWAFHRAWWDAYGDNAHDQALVVVDPDAPEDAPPLGIAPLMHRHEVEPDDAILRTTIRHGHEPDLTPVAPTAKAVFFGASYHADYATLLCSLEDLPRVADAVVDHLCAEPGDDEDHPAPWDVIDLRRLRCDDPAAVALERAFRDHAKADRWTIVREREDVCPVVSLPEGGDLDAYLATLDKKDRHEIRRKVRRAEDRAGSPEAVRLERSSDPAAELDGFVELHQKRWGGEGLFPPTPGGEQSRRFFGRLFELCGADGFLDLSFLSVGERRIAAGVSFHQDETEYLYNAGVDPDARDLSPGVVMTERFVERAIAEGRRRLDFLRGDEPYKYEWGAEDEPIQRLLVVRRDGT